MNMEKKYPNIRDDIKTDAITIDVPSEASKYHHCSTGPSESSRFIQTS
jgi:hypothetical protein